MVAVSLSAAGERRAVPCTGRIELQKVTRALIRRYVCKRGVILEEAGMANGDDIKQVLFADSTITPLLSPPKAMVKESEALTIV